MKTTKVYHAPGYPLDPKKEEKRGWDRAFDCEIIPPEPIILKSETVELKFDTLDEAMTFLLNRELATYGII